MITTFVAFGVEVIYEFIHRKEAFDEVGYVVTVEFLIFIEIVQPFGAFGAGATTEINIK